MTILLLLLLLLRRRRLLHAPIVPYHVSSHHLALEILWIAVRALQRIKRAVLSVYALDAGASVGLQ